MNKQLNNNQVCLTLPLFCLSTTPLNAVVQGIQVRLATSWVVYRPSFCLSTPLSTIAQAMRARIISGTGAVACQIDDPAVRRFVGRCYDAIDQYYLGHGDGRVYTRDLPESVVRAAVILLDQAGWRTRSRPASKKIGGQVLGFSPKSVQDRRLDRLMKKYFS